MTLLFLFAKITACIMRRKDLAQSDRALHICRGRWFESSRIPSFIFTQGED